MQNAAIILLINDSEDTGITLFSDLFLFSYSDGKQKTLTNISMTRLGVCSLCLGSKDTEQEMLHQIGQNNQSQLC